MLVVIRKYISYKIPRIEINISIGICASSRKLIRLSASVNQLHCTELGFSCQRLPAYEGASLCENISFHGYNSQ